MLKKKEIGVIILNYNSSVDSIELYNSLLSFNLPYLHPIIIDNASNKKEVEALKLTIPQEHLILNNKNLGYSGGNNIGIKKCFENNYQYILLLNPDIRLNKFTIPKLIDSLSNIPNAAAIGPRICYRNNPKLIYSDGGIIEVNKGYLSNHINYNKMINDVSLNNTINKVDFVNGSFILMKSEVLKEIGIFKELFFLYYEEAEWCLRANLKGFNCYTNSEAIAYHSSSTKGKKYYYYMIRNRLLLAKLFKTQYSNTRRRIFRTLVKESFHYFTKSEEKLKIQMKWKGFWAGVFYKI